MSSFAPGAPPSVDALFAEWWGGPPADPFFVFDPGAASNIVSGGNPPYQISDFLAMYPKFGSSPQSLVGVAISNGGAGYVVNDQVNVTQPDASGGVVGVTTVAGGAVTGVAIVQPGTGYSVFSGIGTITPDPANPGANYNVGDQLSIIQSGASGGLVQVTAVGLLGQVVSVILLAAGTNYVNGLHLGSVGSPTGSGAGFNITAGLSVTGGSGAGLTLNVTSITPYSSPFPLPQAVLQLYINLASAALQKNRWLDYWSYGMALFVAHFATLYLLSEGNPVSSAGQAAISGLARGLATSKAAGDVSVSYETLLKDMEGWGSWTRTEYGQQLVTFAKTIGSGPMYIYG